MDMLVEDEIVVELKAIDALLPIHEAQILSYLRLSNKRLGLLINSMFPISNRASEDLLTNSE
jgi:GxxExxY protein